MSRSSVASWVAFGGALTSSLFALVPLRGSEAWWHLTLGRLIAANRAVPTSNPLVYTAPSDAPLVVQPWIGDYWLAELHRLGGVAALLGVRNLLAGFAVAIIVYAAYHHGRNVRIATVAGVATGLALIALTTVGPFMFALPLGALIVATLVAVFDERLPSWALLVIVPAAWFWANLAPGFWLVPLIAVGFGAAAAFSRRVRLSATMTVVALLAAGAQLLTPWGVTIAAAVEFDIIEAGSLAAMLAAVLVAARQPSAPTRLRHPLWTAAVVVALGTATVMLQPWFLWHSSVMTSIHADVRAADPMRGLVDSSLPVSAMQIVQSWGSQPRVFHPPEWAGYVAFEAGVVRPTPILWSAPGIESDEARELQRRLIEEPESLWRGVFQQYDVRAVVVPESRYARLIREMSNSDTWMEVSREGEIVLFTRIRRRTDD